MKRILLLLIATSFVACKSDLDKKIAVFEYSETIKKIKESNSEYSEQDFKQASKELDKYTFKALAQEKKELDVTYRQLLDEAKEINIKKAKELEDYQNSLKPLNEAIDVSILDVKYVYDANYIPGYSNFYLYVFKLENKADKSTAAIKGIFYLYNENEELLKKIYFNETIAIPSGEKIEAKDYTVIDTGDNLNELKVLPLEKIKIVWEPEQIIFEGGDRISAGKKPFNIDDF